jgi:ATP-dependent Clp protease adaptor protein ClpS
MQRQLTRTTAQVTEPGRTATLPEREQEQRVRSRALEPHKVVLYNDDVNSMDHVVRSLLRSVPGLSTKKAVDVMMEAHNSGRAVVIVCPLELAELVRDRLESCGLTATIEEA